MTETTIALTLPIRRVVSGDPSATAPEWLRDHYRRLAKLSGASRQALKRGPAKSASLAVQESQLREQVQSLGQAATQLRNVAKTLHAKWEQTLLPELQQLTVELAHAIAAKLVLDRVVSDQFPIENLVREVVERLNTDQTIVVKLNPADFEVWQKQAEAIAVGDHVRVQADATLARGDCQATAGEISIVYELRRQIEELRQQLVS